MNFPLPQLFQRNLCDSYFRDGYLRQCDLDGFGYLRLIRLRLICGLFRDNDFPALERSGKAGSAMSPDAECPLVGGGPCDDLVDDATN